MIEQYGKLLRGGGAPEQAEQRQRHDEEFLDRVFSGEFDRAIQHDDEH